MCISDIGIIELDEMKFHAYHGCLESERQEGNTFIVDFRGETDLRKAAESDCLDDTVNYGEIYEAVKEEMSVASDLLEHVAGRIVRSISEKFPQFEKFTIRVSKMMPPVGGDVKWSRVTLAFNKE